jgi:hypothetical protein
MAVFWVSTLTALTHRSKPLSAQLRCTQLSPRVGGSDGRKANFRAGVVASFPVAAACFGTVARAELPDFQCYRASADADVDRTFTLTDQFGQIEARIERPERLCNDEHERPDPTAASRTEHLAEYTVRRVSGDIEPHMSW